MTDATDQPTPLPDEVDAAILRLGYVSATWRIREQEALNIIVAALTAANERANRLTVQIELLALDLSHEEHRVKRAQNALAAANERAEDTERWWHECQAIVDRERTRREATEQKVANCEDCGGERREAWAKAKRNRDNWKARAEAAERERDELLVLNARLTDHG